MYDSNRQRGYIALTATIIIAAVLLVLTISVASSGFYTRFSVLDSEIKERSRALAEGCIQTAILEYEKDSSYTGGDVFSVNGNECTIVLVDGSSPTDVHIEVRADVQNSITNLRVFFDSTNDYAINSWEEVAEF